MNYLDLFQCLVVVGEFVFEFVCLVDIGLDYVYLFVVLMLKGKIKYVVVGEVV